MTEPEYIYRWSKLCLSTVSVICIFPHLIGGCQVLVFFTNMYTVLSNLIWLILASNNYPVEVASLIPVLGVENVITLASFMCIAGNTEDDTGLSSYEIVAVMSGILWGIHTSHITYLVSKNGGAHVVLRYLGNDPEEPFEI